jgi:hypothetical protein
VVVSFGRFFLDCGPTGIVLGLLWAELALERKPTSLDNTAANAFKKRPIDLAAEKWSGITDAFERASIEAAPDRQGHRDRASPANVLDNQFGGAS